MSKDWLNSVVLITSSDPAIRDFGTGFAVHCDEQATFVLTCAHVVNAVGGSSTVKANDIQATVIALGSDEGIDLAVLYVKGLDRIPLSLSVACEKGKAFTAAGFQWFNNNKEYLFRPLNGILGEQVQVGVTLGKLVKAWDLIITDEYQFQPGNSGSPVVDDSDDVIGVVRTRQDQGKKGLAISIEALEKIWVNMPTTVYKKIATTSLNYFLQKLDHFIHQMPSLQYKLMKISSSFDTYVDQFGCRDANANLASISTPFLDIYKFVKQSKDPDVKKHRIQFEIALLNFNKQVSSVGNGISLFCEKYSTVMKKEQSIEERKKIRDQLEILAQFYESVLEAAEKLYKLHSSS